MNKIFIIIFILGSFFLSKPHNYEIHKEVEYTIHKIIEESVYSYLEENALISPLVLYMIPPIIEQISKEATSTLKINEYIFLKIVFNNSNEIIAIAFLNNIIFIPQYEEESYPVDFDPKDVITI